MIKSLYIGFTAAALATLIGWKYWLAGRLAIDLDARPSVGDSSGAAGSEYGGRGKSDAAQPSAWEGASRAPSTQATKEDQELQEQGKRIAKLRKLKDLLESGGYRADHLVAVLASDEGMWLKAAYIQGAWDVRWAGTEADKAFAEVLGFLEGLDPATTPDTMGTRAYHISMQLMADLNRRGDGKYDEVLKERYENTGNPDYLKTIFDTSYKLGKIRTVPPHQAVAIVRESPTNEYLDYAKSLLASPGITAEDRGDLNKYLGQHGSKADWSVSVSDDRGTRLMKLNGVAASKAKGKVEYIYEQWQSQFFSKTTDRMSYSDWRALPNPSYELAQALWTEEDQGKRERVEMEILGLLKRHNVGGMGEQDQRKQRALVNLAVAFLDLCLSNLVPNECRDELANPRSFGATAARDHLADYLKSPDAAMVLGTAKNYVEKVVWDRREK